MAMPRARSLGLGPRSPSLPKVGKVDPISTNRESVSTAADWSVSLPYWRFSKNSAAAARAKQKSTSMGTDRVGTTPVGAPRGVGVAVGAPGGVGVGVGTPAMHSPVWHSKEPISQALPCGRETPRWSVAGGGQPLAASMAGLPAESA